MLLADFIKPARIAKVYKGDDDETHGAAKPAFRETVMCAHYIACSATYTRASNKSRGNILVLISASASNCRRHIYVYTVCRSSVCRIVLLFAVLWGEKKILAHDSRERCELYIMVLSILWLIQKIIY